MKRFIILALVTACCLSDYAQFKAYNLAESGLLYFIPSYMTKEGKQILYSCNNGYTVYDDNFNIIKQYNQNDPYNDLQYKYREIKYARLIDPETKEFLSDWKVISDNTQDYTGAWGHFFDIMILTEENTTCGQILNLSQTLFDEDEDFEFIRCKYDVIPITVKQEDYINEHTTGGNKNVEPQYSPNDWWREYGAESYETIWDFEKQKEIYQLIKYEKYGGIYSSSLEVVNLDGVVEQTLDGISSGGYTGYHVNENFLIKRQEDNVIYRLNSHKLPESNVRGINYDLNRDGKVNAADHVKLSDFIMSHK